MLAPRGRPPESTDLEMRLTNLPIPSKNGGRERADERADHSRAFRLKAIRMLERLLAEASRADMTANFSLEFSSQHGRPGRLKRTITEFDTTI
jgi:hypothetical protein